MKTPQRKAEAWPPLMLEILIGFRYHAKVPDSWKISEPGGWKFTPSVAMFIRLLRERGLLSPVKGQPFYELTIKGSAVVDRVLLAANAIADRIAPKPPSLVTPKVRTKFSERRAEAIQAAAMRGTSEWHGDAFAAAPIGTTYQDVRGKMYVKNKYGKWEQASVTRYLWQTARGMGLDTSPMGEPLRQGLGRVITTPGGAYTIDDSWLDRYEQWMDLRRAFTGRGMMKLREFNNVFDIIFARTDKLTNKTLERQIWGHAKLTYANGPDNFPSHAAALRHYAMNTITPPPVPK